MPDRRHADGAAAGLLLVLTTSGCSLFGDDEEADTSVFSVEPGTCLVAPAEVEVNITEVDAVPCDQEHTQEAYALVDYVSPDGEGADEFPGEEALTAFADGACAEEFEGYVGVSYLDSSLFFTYLLPSARSWEEDDREVLCLVTSAGRPLTASVKGTAQ